MDFEVTLLSRCVNHGEIDAVVARGIGPQHFENSDNRAVFTTLVQHMTTYREPPSREAVLLSHPAFRFDAPTDSIEFLLDKFVLHVQNREAEKSVIDMAQRLRDPNDHTPADQIFMEYTERVAQVVPSSQVQRLRDAEKRRQEQIKRQAAGVIHGITTGVPELDAILLGVQRHELVVVTAPSSHGKSTFLQHNCMACYLNGTSKTDTPVFISLEMEGDALLRKFDVMATNFEYALLRAMKLGQGDLEKWERWGEKVRDAPNDIIVIDDIDECSVERVFAETLRWRPNAMFVDYFGIMTPQRYGDQSAHVGMANMAKALKRIPRRTGVPLFTAAQTNRAGFKEGVRADNVADTIEIFRSADIMLGLNWDLEDPTWMEIDVVKNRDGKKGTAKIPWDMERLEIGEKFRWMSRKAIAEREMQQTMMKNPFARLAVNEVSELVAA